MMISKFPPIFCVSILAAIFFFTLGFGNDEFRTHTNADIRHLKNALLTLRTNPPFTFAFIDSVPVGELPQPEFILMPGIHHIEIHAPILGHFDTVVVLPRGPTALKINLETRLLKHGRVSK
jgi:hypothetical protein